MEQIFTIAYVQHDKYMTHFNLLQSFRNRENAEKRLNEIMEPCRSHISKKQAIEEENKINYLNYFNKNLHAFTKKSTSIAEQELELAQYKVFLLDKLHLFKTVEYDEDGNLTWAPREISERFNLHKAEPLPKLIEEPIWSSDKTFYSEGSLHIVPSILI